MAYDCTITYLVHKIITSEPHLYWVVSWIEKQKVTAISFLSFPFLANFVLVPF